MNNKIDVNMSQTDNGLFLVRYYANSRHNQLAFNDIASALKEVARAITLEANNPPSDLD